MIPKSTLMVAIKAVHTVVFAISAAAIFYGLWAGITGEMTPFLWLAMAIPIAIWVGLMANGNQCILQTWARNLQSADDWVSDIYLPNRVALNIRRIFTPLYALALFLISMRLIIAAI